MEINYARLHSTTFVPGLGAIKETLDKTQFAELNMNYNDGVLVVKATKSGVKTPVTFLVPLPALAIMTPASGQA
jgi:hypothetical protein